MNKIAWIMVLLVFSSHAYGGEAGGILNLPATEKTQASHIKKESAGAMVISMEAGNGKAELLLLDIEGRKTGKDIAEIPGSSYKADSITLIDPSVAVYVLDVVGKTAGNYALFITGYDVNKKPADKVKFEDVEIIDGVSDRYYIAFSPGGKIKVETGFPLSLLRPQAVKSSIGPFEIDGKSFTAELNKLKIPGGGDFSETVESFEIKDESGATHYKESFDIGMRGNSISWFYYVGVRGLEVTTPKGSIAKGLMIFTDFEPSAPGDFTDCRIFGVKEGNLVRLLPALWGSACRLPEGSKKGFLTLPGVKALKRFPGGQVMLGPDTVDVEVSTGYFGVIVPIVVDLFSLEIRPLYLEGFFKVRAERRHLDGETFVRLFDSREDSIPRHIVVRKETKVEFLEAYARILWHPSGAPAIEVEEPWLKVSIDGQEGYIKDEEDLIAIGLWQAG